MPGLKQQQQIEGVVNRLAQPVVLDIRVVALDD
jgi:hypothetical protein